MDKQAIWHCHRHLGTSVGMTRWLWVLVQQGVAGTCSSAFPSAFSIGIARIRVDQYRTTEARWPPELESIFQSHSGSRLWYRKARWSLSHWLRRGQACKRSHKCKTSQAWASQTIFYPCLLISARRRSYCQFLWDQPRLGDLPQFWVSAYRLPHASLPPSSKVLLESK